MSTNTAGRNGTAAPTTAAKASTTATSQRTQSGRHSPNNSHPRPHKPTIEEMTQQVNNLTDMIMAMNREWSALLVAIWEQHRTRMTADKARRR